MNKSAYYTGKCCVSSFGINKLDRPHLILPSVLHDLFIDNLIHDLEAFDGLLLCDAHIGLLQGHWTETAEEEKIVIRVELTRLNKKTPRQWAVVLYFNEQNMASRLQNQCHSRYNPLC